MELELYNKSNKIYNYFKITNYDTSQNKILITINEVLNNNECDKIISMSELKGFTQASFFTDKFGKEHFYNDIRQSKRCIIDDDKFVKALYQRISHYIPQTYKGTKFDSINPRLRILKYYPDDYFTRHQDGKYFDAKNNTVSKITVLIYLNDNYSNGYTKTYFSSSDTIGHDIIPFVGMICLMDHDIEHEVKPLKSGIKYVIRTDLMYKI